MKLVSVTEMKVIEEEANAAGLTYEKMMEQAGYNLSQEVMRLTYNLDNEEGIQVLGLVGPGNNGGDTLIALARLAEKGWTSRAYLVRRKAGDPLAQRLENAGGETFDVDEDDRFGTLKAFLETTDVLLDGLLGTGCRLPVKKDMGAILATVKGAVNNMEWPPLVIAVDCPSGIDADTGEAGDECIPADATITMAAMKRGLLQLPAFQLAGEIKVAGIGDLAGLTSWQAIQNEIAEEEKIATMLPERPLDSHKGTYGAAVIAAGSLNYTGAALLAGRAAGRIGAGLVTLAIPAPLHTPLAGHFQEATWILLPHEMGVISSPAAEVLMKNLDRATAFLVGPGLGTEETTGEFLEKILNDRPAGRLAARRIGFLHGEDDAEAIDKNEGKILPAMVIDADGLKLLAKIENWQKKLPADTILTPHPGEMAFLTGLSVEDIQKDRLETTKQHAKAWGQVIVLKGAFTVVAAPDGRTTTIPVATSALAHAGTGDVLAGLITGLRAQGLGAYEAAAAGAWIHAQAGEIASELQGTPAAVLAGDVVDCIADVLNRL